MPGTTMVSEAYKSVQSLQARTVESLPTVSFAKQEKMYANLPPTMATQPYYCNCWAHVAVLLRLRLRPSPHGRVKSQTTSFCLSY